MEKVPCRSPAPGKHGITRIPAWKFHLLRGHILTLIAEAGERGVAFSELAGLVGARLTADEKQRLGSIGWHVTTVKLEMEVAGDIARSPGSGPQYLVKT